MSSLLKRVSDRPPRCTNYNSIGWIRGNVYALKVGVAMYGISSEKIPLNFFMPQSARVPQGSVQCVRCRA